MRVIIATTAHLPGDVRVRFKIVESMLDNGYQVTWAGPRNHDDGVPVGDLPSGARFVWLDPVAGRRSRLTTPMRLRRTLAQYREPADWVYCPDPDALLAVAPMKRRGARIWFDIHERYHNDHAAGWLGPFDGRRPREALHKLITAGASRSDLVTSPSPAVLSDYAPDHPNAHLLLNSVSSHFSRGLLASSRMHDERMVLMHGKPGRHRGTRELAEALVILSSRGRTVSAVSIGSNEQLRDAVGTALAQGTTDPSQPARFEVVEPIPHEEMGRLTAGCHVGAVGYTGSLAEASFPNRLFEYMALGLPVVAPVDSPHIEHVITEFSCGLTYRNSDPETLAATIDRLYTDPELAAAMGARGREAFTERFTWEAQFDRIARFLA